MTTIKQLHSSTSGNVPASLAAGQFGINEADRVINYRDPAGSVAKWRPEVLIGHGSVSNVATLDFVLPTSKFTSFRFRFTRLMSDIADTGGDILYAQLSTNGGSTFDEGYNYTWSYEYIRAIEGDEFTATGVVDDNAALITMTSLTSGEDYCTCDAVMNIHHSSSYYSVAGWSRSWQWSYNVDNRLIMSAWVHYGTAAIPNAIRFKNWSSDLYTDYAFYGVHTP